jgi:pimeloyl-ACP methyl ester carboxylesterase
MRGCTLKLILQGGHFAALEQPEAFLDDVLDFVKTVWKA